MPDEQKVIKQLKQSIAEEQAAQSVLKRVLSLLQNKTKRQKQSQDQHKIKQLRNSISKDN